MTIEAFMNQIDEVKRIQTLRHQIGEIQKELGFDDVVAEYVLQNAPDGADDKDLIILAIKGAVGPDVTIEETDGTNEVLVIDDAKDIIPLTTKIMSFDYVEDLKVTPLLNGKLKAEAKTSSIVLSNLHTSVVFQKETTNTPFSFISETTDLVGWHIALDWVETYLDKWNKPKLI